MKEGLELCGNRMKKDKGVMVSGPNSGEESDEKESFPAVRFSSRNTSSKYDFVKVSFLVIIHSQDNVEGYEIEN